MSSGEFVAIQAGLMLAVRAGFGATMKRAVESSARTLGGKVIVRIAEAAARATKSNHPIKNRYISLGVQGKQFRLSFSPSKWNKAKKGTDEFRWNKEAHWVLRRWD